jgi:ATP/maltotriose-dependent transcriptional regulator MalT
MQAWIDAMERWCDVNTTTPYYGVCDVHRLQLAAADADYGHLEDQLLTASVALEGINSWVCAAGYYEMGEVRRLRGNSDGAMAAFAKTRGFGVDPQPGEALLKCKLGLFEAAWTDLRLALSGADHLDRMRLLWAAAEVALIRDALDEAEEHCRELAEGAAAFDTPGFRGWAAHARGAVLVRRGDDSAALVSLKAALREYRTQRWRFEMAEVYEWMALAHRGLGLDDLAAADVSTAENVYRQLGVKPSGVCERGALGGLTRRELEVLRAIAGGATNRQVAQQISISEMTVRRHLANVYAKLGVSSRTAAVAWAYQNYVVVNKH